MGNILGFIFGPILLIGAIFLLSWNEGRAVQALNGLSDASQAVVEADPSAPTADEGKLVHVVGPAIASAPISDPDLSIPFPGQVAVARTVQMYQWRETKHTPSTNGSQQTTYSYDQAWLEQPVDSSAFNQPAAHANPPMPFTDARWVASDARLGGYALSADTVNLTTLTAPLTPSAPDGWTAAAGALVKGDPAAPKIGDLKVSYLALASGSTLSVLAEQSGGGFGPFVAPNGYKVEMVDIGNEPASAMITAQRNNETTMTWILRVVGFIGIFVGVLIFLSPLSRIASFVPFLGSIVSGAAFLAALVIAVPATLVVVSLSWIVFRPLVGIGLLALAAALLFGLRWMHARAHPAVKPAGV